METDYPSVTSVQYQWEDYVKNNRHLIGDDIIGLSLNQKKILVALAKKPVKELYGAEFLTTVKLTQSSIRKAIDVLIEKDLVHCSEGRYQVLDPAIEFYILTHL